MRYFWMAMGIFLGVTLHAQDDYRFEVKSPTQVAVSQPFDVQFIITSDKGIRASNFKAPTFNKDFEVHHGPSQSQSSSTSIINGQRSQTVSLILTYRVSARREGTLNFGPASVDIEGKTYKTSGVSLSAKKMSQQQQQQQNQRNTFNPFNPFGQSAPQTQTQTPAEISKNDVSIRAFANKYTPYEGEEVLLDYTLSTNIPIHQYNIYKKPSSQGFWSESVALNAKPTQNGRTVSVNLDRSIIYPQRSGKLTIDPLEVEVLARVSTRPRSQDPFDFFNDPFGFGAAQLVTQKVSSNRVNFNVKPLPEKGKPESFKGNVGRFTFTSKIDKTTLKTNEALTISITLEGHGNLRHIEAPTVLFPADFEVYEPQETENIHVGTGGMTGSKTFEFLAIPRTQGSYVIPPIEFSYFDPAQGKYVENQTEEYRITVNKGDGKFAPAAHATPDNPYLNRDIEFIKTQTSTLRDASRKFLFSPLFWGIFTLPFVLLVVLLIVRKRLDIRNADVVGLRNKRALKEARRNLRKAEKFMMENNKDAFYVEISQALWGFLSKKFNIPIAELSIENVQQTLLGKNIDFEYVEQFLKALENCEFARFAPNGNSTQSMKEVYDEALGVISGIVRYLAMVKASRKNDASSLS